MSAHLALKKIAWECFSQLQGNQDTVLYGVDEEGVHQMRIALRRLRSSLNIFGSIINQHSCTHIIKDLRWITNVLGQARDLDVFAKHTLPSILQLYPDQPSLIQLNEKAHNAGRKAKNKVRKAIRSQRYQHMLLSVGDWLENERWRKNNSVEYKVLEIARPMLSKRHKQLKKQGKFLMQVPQKQRHATRIAAKKLRYAIEFFSHLYPKGKLRNFLPALTKLSDTLGALNDICISENIAQKLIGKQAKPALMQSLDILANWNAYNTKLQLQNLKRNWKRFEQLKPRWD